MSLQEASTGFSRLLEEQAWDVQAPGPSPSADVAGWERAGPDGIRQGS